jgi:hypothetical protein
MMTDDELNQAIADAIVRYPDAVDPRTGELDLAYQQAVLNTGSFEDGYVLWQSDRQILYREQASPLARAAVDIATHLQGQVKQ